jgi:hypothetical protein
VRGRAAQPIRDGIDANQFTRVVTLGSDVVLEDREPIPWKV